jgi:pyruvate dehydrogenase E2 component (dihydrolipoamide acetyltransferase)
MAQFLEMPRLSDTVTVGLLQKWRKNEGDTVVPGEIVAEVETDKAVIDVEALDRGVLLKRLIGDGASVSVGTPIAIIGKAGEEIGTLVEEARSRAEAGAPKPAAAPLPARLAPERRTEARPTAPPDDVVKPLSMMRRTIAARLLEAKTTVPHFYLTAEIDMDAAMEFREQAAQAQGARLSINDLVLKACGLAMRRVPEANASFSEEAIIQHARVDIGMAVAIEDGLITPVIRDADKKPLSQVAREAHEMAGRARDRKLRPDEYTGATFSVSNLGRYGIREFAAIINPPEGAILAVGNVRKEPVVKDNKIAIGHRMAITLSCDHRVIDGALGAKVLQTIVGILENPSSLAS